MSFFEQATSMLGSNPSSSGIDVGTILMIFGLIILFGVIAAIVTFAIMYKMQYKIKIKLFERIDGRFQPIRNGKGKEKILLAKKIPLGNGGDSVLQVKKPKKMLPMPTLQTGSNTYWYFVSDDDEWINFSPGDFDKDRQKMGAHMLDKEMRYARTSLQTAGKERYDQESFIKKYGGMIAYSALIIVTAVGFFLIVKQMGDTVSASSQAVDAARQVIEEIPEILKAADNVKGGISPSK